MRGICHAVCMVAALCQRGGELPMSMTPSFGEKNKLAP